MVVHPDLHTAYVWLTKTDLEEFNHVKGDTEGFANMLLAINGMVLSVLFVERTGFVKMSLRSKGNSTPMNCHANASTAEATVMRQVVR